MSDKLCETLRAISETAKKPKPHAVIPQYCEDFYAEDVLDATLAERYAGKFNILFAGNISPAQDLENLAEAVRLCRESGLEGLRCIIVGDGMSRDGLQALVEEKGVADLFEFAGSCAPTDIPRWTGVADALFAGLSKSANLGLTVPAKITSYFAAGRPLLVAADGEAGRVSAESGAALVSAASDSEALAANIRRLHGMGAKERTAMGENGRRVYREQYSREKLLGQLQAFILGEEVPG